MTIAGYNKAFQSNGKKNLRIKDHIDFRELEAENLFSFSKGLNYSPGHTLCAHSKLVILLFFVKMSYFTYKGVAIQSFVFVNIDFTLFLTYLQSCNAFDLTCSLNYKQKQM